MLSLIAALLFGVVEVRHPVDPITDARGSFVVIKADGRYVSLGCSDVADRKSFVVKIGMNNYLGDATAGILAGGRPVEYRFGASSPSTLLWHSHDDYVFATPPEARPVLFATEMRNTRRLVVRTYAYSGQPYTAVFDYDDPTLAIDSALSDCGFDREGRKLKR